MADGAGDLFRSRILGMGLEDTPYQQQAVSGMLGGATPEQLQSFFGSPQVQEQFRNFGIDPQQFTQNIRQSPFLPNSFMQGHPQLGGAISHGLANMAATPAAPLVSGAGSGLTRAAQGAMGGQDLIRQFQLHQMMAPFGMMAGMMPTYGEERRRAIEEAIVKETQERMKLQPAESEARRLGAEARMTSAQAAEDRARAAEEAAHRPQVHFGPIGTGYTTIQDIPYSPEGGAQGLDLTQQGMGQRPPVVPPSGPLVGQPQPMPGSGLTPEQQAGWQIGYTPYDQASMEGQFRAKATGGQTPEKGALLTAQAGAANAKAAETRYKATPQYRIAMELGKADQNFNNIREKIDDKYNPLITTVGADSEQGKAFEQQRQNEIAASTANYLVRIQHAGGQITSEQQQWLQQYQMNQGQLPPQVAPNAPSTKPTSSRANQQGPPTSPTTATPSYQY